MVIQTKLQKLYEAKTALEGALQLLNPEQLSIISGSVLSLQEMAKAELTKRGLNKKGEWVGYGN